MSWADRDVHPTASADSMGGSVSRSGSSAALTLPSQQPKSYGTAKPEDLSTNEQARIYQRANENLVTQTVYLEQNLDRVTGAIKDIDSGNATSVDDLADSVPTLTSQYCSADTVRSSPDTSAARGCLDQFRQMRVAQLRDLQQEVLKNNDTQSRLRDGLASAKSPSGKSNHAPVYGAQIKSRVFPVIPKYVDMQKDFSARAKVNDDQAPVRKAAETLAKRMMTPPDPSDFVKTTEALIDPKNPSAGTFKQIVLGQDGKPQLDNKGYQRALAVYQKMHLQGQSKNPQGQTKNPKVELEEITNRILAAQDAQRKKLKVANTLDTAVGTKYERPGAVCSSLDGARRDYCEARDLIVGVFNGENDKTPAPGAKANTLHRGDPVRAPSSALGQGRGTENHELVVDKPLKNSKEESDSNLYMDTGYIDSVIDRQFP